jgi:hypothetical protein
MGASVVAYRPGITERQVATQPGFFNDDRAWGNWIAQPDGDVAVSYAIRKATGGGYPDIQDRRLV